MNVEIRAAAPADEAGWRDLWQQYLLFYKAQVPEAATAQNWARCMDSASGMVMRLAILDGAVVGFAIHHQHYSTWEIGLDCYLEDLFVTDVARGTGAGRALLDDLVALCRARGNGRLYWHTDVGNIRARKVYDYYAKADNHVRYRIKL